MSQKKGNGGQLLELKAWLEQRFVEPRPSMRTAQSWCENGHVPAKKIGRKWFVQHELELRQTGNDLVDSVLGV